MFDWDKDYDGLIVAAPTAFAPGAKDAPRTVLPQRFAKGMTFAAILLCAGALGYAIASKSRALPDLTQVGLMGFVPFGTSGPSVGLQVLEDSQSTSFQAGLRAFSEADLLRYASTTRKDLKAAAGFMQPYLADALVLIEAELFRRGL